MDAFLPYKDALGNRINNVAIEFYNKLSTISDLNNLGLNDRILSYFQNSHFKRQFFSIQTAAELLYRSIKLSGKNPEELTVVDYGAGVGSLYLMAKLLGCKKVIHADIMEDMYEAGQNVATALNIQIDEYILGDHNQFLQQLEIKKIKCDIILSRNVIEHIYDLEDFYKKMLQFQPDAIHYSSTTANFQNPAMLIFHKRLHKNAEKEFVKKRYDIIKKKHPEWTENKLQKAAIATRGLAGNDIDKAVTEYQEKGILPNPQKHYTNTCDPENGVWWEHIIPAKEYKSMLEPLGYNVEVLPAFSDTHYSKFYKNWVGKTMNFCTKILGKKHGLKTSAFMYVVMQKKK